MNDCFVLIERFLNEMTCDGDYLIRFIYLVVQASGSCIKCTTIYVFTFLTLSTFPVGRTGSGTRIKPTTFGGAFTYTLFSHEDGVIKSYIDKTLYSYISVQHY